MANPAIIVHFFLHSGGARTPPQNDRNKEERVADLLVLPKSFAKTSFASFVHKLEARNGINVVV